MAHTEFFVRTDGNDVFGGSSDSATADYNTTDCDSSADGLTLTDNSGSDWSGVAVDDWLIFDPTGTKNHTRVTVVAPGADATKVTVSPAVATSALTKAVNVGGSWATVDFAVTSVTISTINAAGDHPRINIKAGTYSENVVLDTNPGSAAVAYILQGFTSTPGDVPTGTGRPLITQAGTGDTVEVSGSAGLITFCDLRMEKTGTAGRAFDVSNKLVNGYRCQFTAGGTGATTGVYNPSSISYFEECEFEVTSTSASAEATELFGCLAYGCVWNQPSGSADVVAARHTGHCFQCVFLNGVTHPIKLESHTALIGCTIRGDDATGDGVEMGAARGNGRVSNTLVTSHGAWGIDAGNGYILGSGNNLGPGSGAEQNVSGTATGSYHNTGRADANADPDFVSAPGDLRLNSTSADKGAANPGTLPGESYASSMDRGGVQRLDPVGGGGVMDSPGMDGGMN